MISVGTMVEREFVDVKNEPWLCLGVDPRVGQLLVIEDLIVKIKIDPSFNILFWTFDVIILIFLSLYGSFISSWLSIFRFVDITVLLENGMNGA